MSKATHPDAQADTNANVEAKALDALARAKATDGIFVSFCEAADVKASADSVAARLSAGENLPLAGITFSVKDNLDVAGMATTANCPGYGHVAQ